MAKKLKQFPNKNKLFSSWVIRNYEGSKNGVKVNKMYDFVYCKLQNEIELLVFDGTIKQKLFNFYLTKKYNSFLSTVNKKIKSRGSADFYSTKNWILLKNKVHRMYKCGCMKCGVTDTETHIDHIFPRSLYPKFELDIHNLQILCKNCNIEKSNKNTIDYRTLEQKKLCSIKHN